MFGQLRRHGPLALGQEGQDAPLAPRDAELRFAHVHHQPARRDVDAVEPVQQQVGLVLWLGQSVVEACVRHVGKTPAMIDFCN
ncbi:hypothetical protein FQZ97_880090 [compost metagenome]